MDIKAVILLFVVLSVSHSSGYTVIAIYQSGDTYDAICLDGSDKNYTIDQLSQESLHDNTLIRICSRFIILSKIINLTSKENVTVKGHYKPIIECSNHSEAGLNFSKAVNLELAHFTISRCSFKVSIDKEVPDVVISHNIDAGISIQNCSNVSIVDLIVTNSSGTGLALFNNHEEVTIIDSSFIGNGQDNATGGNGIYLEFNDFVQTRTQYTIHNCIFRSNIANTGKDRKIFEFSRFDKGGGLCVCIVDGTGIFINITNSTFNHNMALDYGGGMFSTFYGNRTRNCTISVTRSVFAHNSATYGGGHYAGYLQYHLTKHTKMNCSYVFKSCTFMNNHAIETGGGTSLFSTKTITKDTEAKVLFENCTWSDNKARHGSAIAVLPNAWHFHEDGYSPVPVFQNCDILSNTYTDSFVTKSVNNYTLGSGALYCSGHTLVFSGTVKFRQNTGTALLMNYCTAVFSTTSNINFTNNTGHNGGAMYMLSSVMYLEDNSKIVFSENKAYAKGGAIYHHTPDSYTISYSKTCFMNYNGTHFPAKNRNVTVQFMNNRAGIKTNEAGYGHSIYASSLLPCQREFNSSMLDIFGQIGKFMFSPNRTMEIATEINHIECLDGCSKWSDKITFIPGKEKAVPFKTIDDLNHSICSDYQVNIGNDTIRMGQNHSHITNNILALYGKPSSEARVTLSSISSQQVALSFRAIMLPCPPGMILNKNTTLLECTCSSSRIPGGKYDGIKGCDYIHLRAYRFQGYWFGYSQSRKESEDSLVSGYCPPGFCSDKTLLPSIANRTMLERTICSDSRTGVLCGKCKPGLSVHYHSLGFKCKCDKYCKWGWLFYILSEILPVTIIFLVVIFFNVSFTSGLLHGFIFYAQVVEMLQITANHTVHIPESANTSIRLHYLIYLFFNLDTFVLDEISYCVWKGANSLDVLAFSYVTLTYSFLLIVMVMVAVSKCRCKCLGFDDGSGDVSQSRNMLHGFSAFFVLFYLHATRVSILILSPMLIQSKDPGTGITVVYYNGEMEWLKGQHLFYALPAIIIITLVSAPPLLLLVYPLHYKILSLFHIAELRCIKALFNPLEKLKPFFDSFQGSFKDEYRFFSGLYFLYRFLLLINIAIATIEQVHILTGIEICIMLLLHSACQPYRERLHNIIDSLLFGNLILINMITIYNFFAINSSVKPLLNTSVSIWIQVILVLLPMLIFILSMFVKIYFIKQCCLKLTKLVRNLKSREHELQESKSFSYGTFCEARATY